MPDYAGALDQLIQKTKIKVLPDEIGNAIATALESHALLYYSIKLVVDAEGCLVPN